MTNKYSGLRILLQRPKNKSACFACTLLKYLKKTGWQFSSDCDIHNILHYDPTKYGYMMKDGRVNYSLTSQMKLAFLLAMYKLFINLVKSPRDYTFYVGRMQLWGTFNKIHKLLFGQEIPIITERTKQTVLMKLVRWSSQNGYFVIHEKKIYKPPMDGERRRIYTTDYFVCLLPRFALSILSLLTFLREFSMVNPNTKHYSPYRPYIDEKREYNCDELSNAFPYVDENTYATLGATIRKEFGDVMPNGILEAPFAKLNKANIRRNLAGFVLLALMHLSSFTLHKYGGHKEFYVTPIQLKRTIEQFFLPFIDHPEVPLDMKEFDIAFTLLVENGMIDAYKLKFRAEGEDYETGYFVTFTPTFYKNYNALKKMFSKSPIWQAKTLPYDKLNSFANVIKKWGKIALASSYIENYIDPEKMKANKKNLIPIPFWNRSIFLWALIASFEKGIEAKGEKIGRLDIEPFKQKAEQLCNSLSYEWRMALLRQEAKEKWQRANKLANRKVIPHVDFFNTMDIVRRILMGDAFFYKLFDKCKDVDYYFRGYDIKEDDYVFEEGGKLLWKFKELVTRKMLEKAQKVTIYDYARYKPKGWTLKREYVPNYYYKNHFTKSVKSFWLAFKLSLMDIVGKFIYEDLMKWAGRHWQAGKQKWGVFRKTAYLLKDWVQNWWLGWVKPKITRLLSKFEYTILLGQLTN